MSHARLSPSAADRWFACPASVNACEQYPDTTSQAALDGTRTHYLLEQCLVNSKSPLELVGSSLTIEADDVEDTFFVDSERANRVQTALDYIYERAVLIGGDIVPETKVDAGSVIGRDDIKGTADVRIVGKTEIEIIDYKDGMGRVDPEENKQMAIYAIGVIRELDHETYKRINKVTLTIIQPKLAIKGIEPVRSWSTTKEWIDDFTYKMKEAAELTDKDDAEFVAGEKQCQWCKHKGACSAYMSYTTGGGMNKMINITIQDSDTLTDDQIADIVRKAPEIRKMLDAVEQEALNRAKSGKKLNGLKVIKTSGRRKWALPDDEIVTKLQRMGVPKSVSIVKKIVTPAQIEKLTWSKGGEEKRLSERQIKTLNSEYVEMSEGNYKIVPESSSGKPVEFNMAQYFVSTENVNEGESDEVTELPNWLN